MKINRIHIRNFKGFEDRSFDFDPTFNVVVGKNATGKSTVVNALEVALGGYLQCLGIPATPQYRRQFRAEERLIKWNPKEKDYFYNKENTSISATATFDLGNIPNMFNQIEWTRELLKNNTTSHNRRLAGDLIDISEKIKEHKDSIPMPIVLGFGTKRTNSQIRKGKEKQEKRRRLDKAFLAALNDKVDYDGVIEWIHNYEKNLKYGKEFERTKEAVFSAIHTAIPYLKNIEYNNYYLQLEADIEIDGYNYGTTLQSNMSDGLRVMLKMVAEIAYRCAVLNGFLGERAVLETPGVVLIDEIDMHLHPNWQRRVISDLKAAFPKIQFITTTHSPFIIQSLQRNELLILDDSRERVIDFENPYGSGIEDISQVMGVEEVPRSKQFIEYSKTAEAYFNLIEQGVKIIDPGELQALKEKLREYEDRFSDNPVYVALMRAERSRVKL